MAAKPMLTVAETVIRAQTQARVKALWTAQVPYVKTDNVLQPHVPTVFSTDRKAVWIVVVNVVPALKANPAM
jgi:hypothetical protein